jgi:uncharacterized protein (TIGR03435 family)
VDRRVVDRTGLTGKWNVRLEFARPEDSTRTAADAVLTAVPSVFTAVQEQLGLRLEAARGSEEYLVIESIERPTEN